MFYVWLLVMLWVGAALGFFAAALFSSARKNSSYGVILVDRNEDGGVVYTLEVDGDLDELQNADEVSFRVIPRNGDSQVKLSL